MEMYNPLHAVLSSAIERLLRPLVRILLAHGVGFDSFMEMTKRAYVNVGMREFAITGKRESIARVSALTGLTRRDVQRVLQERAALEVDTGERFERAARVIAGWVRDPDFADAGDQPRPLALEDTPTGFGALVRRYSSDMPMRAVYDELLRVGAVTLLPDGQLRLLERAYVPRASAADKLGILGTDVADLIRTIDHNFERGISEPRFQRKVVYDNLPSEAAARFRAMSAVNAQQLLERLDEWLAAHDRDITPGVAGNGRVRAGIGIYYFQEDLAQDSTEG
jgi:hypothetical protein